MPYQLRLHDYPEFSKRASSPYEPRESAIAKTMRSFLERRNWKMLRQQSGVFLTLDQKRHVPVGEKGLPDYVCVHELYPAFFLETKRPGAKRSSEQVTKHWELEKQYHLTTLTTDRLEALVPWVEAWEKRWKK